MKLDFRQKCCTEIRNNKVRNEIGEIDIKRNTTKGYQIFENITENISKNLNLILSPPDYIHTKNFLPKISFFPKIIKYS